MTTHSRMAPGADNISALPDEALQHILGFLQADEAVRTSVLAPCWRDLWRSMPVLRVTREVPVRSLTSFLRQFFCRRETSSRLDECAFRFELYSEDDVASVNAWVRHALLCQVQVLSVLVSDVDAAGLELAMDFPVVSQYLTKLDLKYPILYDEFLDFSSCPSLKDLRMTECYIAADKIASRSLEYLSIESCSCSQERRIRISARNLISLRLIDIYGRTPIFEDMPLLLTAVVQLHSDCADSCYSINPGYCNGACCQQCYGTNDGSAGCVLLKSFSAAMDLKLIAQPEVFILKRDLRWCPAFTKLKTLSLSEWCVAADGSALICILQHSRFLEKLTFELSEGSGNMVPSEAMFNFVEQSFTLENLKIVLVTCHQVDWRVDNILVYLISCNIPLEKINIHQKNRLSESFNFVDTKFS